MSDGDACAHLRVSWRTEGLPGGYTRGWWECDSNCGAKFATVPPTPAAGPDGAEVESDATLVGALAVKASRGVILRYPAISPGEMDWLAEYRSAAGAVLARFAALRSRLAASEQERDEARTAAIEECARECCQKCSKGAPLRRTNATEVCYRYAHDGVGGVGLVSCFAWRLWEKAAQARLSTPVAPPPTVTDALRAEREECAKVCESRAAGMPEPHNLSARLEAEKCAMAIRSRLAPSALALRGEA